MAFIALMLVFDLGNFSTNKQCALSGISCQCHCG